ncbi:MAG: alpha/beta hydrolase [Sphingopyxis sp.]|nr:alpha/beta hydrolase [Sphingopyxis sp.]
MRNLLKTFALATALSLSGTAMAQSATSAKPTIILVHGAFAGSSSWNGVIAELEGDGYRVIAAANPLRGVASDGAAVSALVKSVAGPVILVGHSYGGPVITAAANGNGNVKALVYVSAFAPDTGETALGLSGKFPGSTLGDALAPPVLLSDGLSDLYIDQVKFPQQFAADVPLDQARLMAATQRPVTQSALAEAAGTATWKSLPTYAIYGSADRNIPPAVLKFMADRARSRETVVVDGASHVVMISHPRKVAMVIEDAAQGK